MDVVLGCFSTHIKLELYSNVFYHILIERVTTGRVVPLMVVFFSYGIVDRGGGGLQTRPNETWSTRQ